MKTNDNVYVLDLDLLEQKAGSSLSLWLQHAGSFMQRLQQHGVNDARIRVISEGWQVPEEEEIKKLRLSSGASAWIREVTIYNDQSVWMFARTVIPRDTLTEKEEFQHLQTRPLGSLLFNNPHMQRSAFEFFCIAANTAWYKKIAPYLPFPHEELFARCSQFTLHEKSLLLTEVFFSDVSRLSP